MSTALVASCKTLVAFGHHGLPYLLGINSHARYHLSRFLSLLLLLSVLDRIIFGRD